MNTILSKDEASSPDAPDVNSTAVPHPNEALREKYDQMHAEGASSWFDDGKEEREMIFNMGIPWEGLSVLEIGCGEGDLLNRIHKEGGSQVMGIDYSQVAIEKAKKKYPDLELYCRPITEQKGCFDRVVMQGVLEHLDEPWEALKWIIDNLLMLKAGDVITSSPDFVNPRGIVWMTLDMLGAVMSKTDLHFLHPWEFEDFCLRNRYQLTIDSCDRQWAGRTKMTDDLKQRLPLALRDGFIGYKQDNLTRFLAWLEMAGFKMISDGAVAVYRIKK